MKEYIEREQAIALFYPVNPENDGSDGCTIVYKSGNFSSSEIEAMLSDLSAADVAEVRHGRWIPKINHTYIPVEYDENGIPVLHEYISYRCSLCSREETKEEPYCHCGARMDKEDEHGSEFD